MTTELRNKTKRTDELLIPERRIVNRKGKEFECLQTNGNYQALKELKEQKYSPVFMPQLLDARIEAPKDSRLWQVWYSTPSIRATGKTKQGNKVVAYSHTENYFSNPENQKMALDQGLVNYAGRIPQDEFQRLVNDDGITDESGNRLVWIIDYDTLRKSSSDSIKVNKALEHPQTIPFIGGEERAFRYLEKHKEVYGNNIGIWHKDDLCEDGEQPLGRLLCVGNYVTLGLYGGLNYLARLVGVRDGAEGATQKISRPSAPSLEDAVNSLAEIHPEDARKAYKIVYRERLKEYFK